MLIVVSYDVPDDRRRTRLAHTLKDFGERVQYSVFECRLDERALQALRLRITRLIDPAEDSLRIYRLCLECDRQLELWGRPSAQTTPISTFFDN
jgi:CRISPR-associated protein Cas2